MSDKNLNMNKNMNNFVFTRSPANVSNVNKSNNVNESNDVNNSNSANDTNIFNQNNAAVGNSNFSTSFKTTSIRPFNTNRYYNNKNNNNNFSGQKRSGNNNDNTMFSRGSIASEGINYRDNRQYGNVARHDFRNIAGNVEGLTNKQIFANFYNKTTQINNNKRNNNHHRSSASSSSSWRKPDPNKPVVPYNYSKYAKNIEKEYAEISSQKYFDKDLVPCSRVPLSVSFVSSGIKQENKLSDIITHYQPPKELSHTNYDWQVTVNKMKADQNEIILKNDMSDSFNNTVFPWSGIQRKENGIEIVYAIINELIDTVTNTTSQTPEVIAVPTSDRNVYLKSPSKFLLHIMDKMGVQIEEGKCILKDDKSSRRRTKIGKIVQATSNANKVGFGNPLDLMNLNGEMYDPENEENNETETTRSAYKQEKKMREQASLCYTKHKQHDIYEGIDNNGCHVWITGEMYRNLFVDKTLEEEDELQLREKHEKSAKIQWKYEIDGEHSFSPLPPNDIVPSYSTKVCPIARKAKMLLQERKDHTDCTKTDQVAHLTVDKCDEIGLDFKLSDFNGNLFFHNSSELPTKKRIPKTSPSFSFNFPSSTFDFKLDINQINDNQDQEKATVVDDENEQPTTSSVNNEYLLVTANCNSEINDVNATASKTDEQSELISAFNDVSISTDVVIKPKEDQVIEVTHAPISPKEVFNKIGKIHRMVSYKHQFNKDLRNEMIRTNGQNFDNRLTSQIYDVVTQNRYSDDLFNYNINKYRCNNPANYLYTGGEAQKIVLYSNSDIYESQIKVNTTAPIGDSNEFNFEHPSLKMSELYNILNETIDKVNRLPDAKLAILEKDSPIYTFSNDYDHNSPPPENGVTLGHYPKDLCAYIKDISCYCSKLLFEEIIIDRHMLVDLKDPSRLLFNVGYTNNILHSSLGLADFTKLYMLQYSASVLFCGDSHIYANYNSHFSFLKTYSPTSSVSYSVVIYDCNLVSDYVTGDVSSTRIDHIVLLGPSELVGSTLPAPYCTRFEYLINETICGPQDTHSFQGVGSHHSNDNKNTQYRFSSLNTEYLPYMSVLVSVLTENSWLVQYPRLYSSDADPSFIYPMDTIVIFGASLSGALQSISNHLTSVIEQMLLVSALPKTTSYFHECFASRYAQFTTDVKFDTTERHLKELHVIMSTIRNGDGFENSTKNSIFFDHVSRVLGKQIIKRSADLVKSHTSGVLNPVSPVSNVSYLMPNLMFPQQLSSLYVTSQAPKTVIKQLPQFILRLLYKATNGNKEYTNKFARSPRFWYHRCLDVEQHLTHLNYYHMEFSSSSAQHHICHVCGSIQRTKFDMYICYASHQLSKTIPTLEGDQFNYWRLTDYINIPNKNVREDIKRVEIPVHMAIHPINGNCYLGAMTPDSATFFEDLSFNTTPFTSKNTIHLAVSDLPYYLDVIYTDNVLDHYHHLKKDVKVNKIDFCSPIRHHYTTSGKFYTETNDDHSVSTKYTGVTLFSEAVTFTRVNYDSENYHYNVQAKYPISYDLNLVSHAYMSVLKLESHNMPLTALTYGSVHLQPFFISLTDSSSLTGDSLYPTPFINIKEIISSEDTSEVEESVYLLRRFNRKVRDYEKYSPPWCYRIIVAMNKKAIDEVKNTSNSCNQVTTNLPHPDSILYFVAPLHVPQTPNLVYKKNVAIMDSIIEKSVKQAAKLALNVPYNKLNRIAPQFVSDAGKDDYVLSGYNHYRKPSSRSKNKKKVTFNLRVDSEDEIEQFESVGSLKRKICDQRKQIKYYRRVLRDHPILSDFTQPQNYDDADQFINSSILDPISPNKLVEHQCKTENPHNIKKHPDSLGYHNDGQRGIRSRTHNTLAVHTNQSINIDSDARSNSFTSNDANDSTSTLSTQTTMSYLNASDCSTQTTPTSSIDRSSLDDAATTIMQEYIPKPCDVCARNTKKMADMRNDINYLTSQLDESRKELDKIIEKSDELFLEVKNYDTLYVTASKERDLCVDDKNKLRSQMDSLVKDLESLKIQHKNATDDAATIQIELKDKRTIINDYAEKIRDLQLINESLNKSIRDKTNEFQISLSNVSKLQHDLKAANSERVELELIVENQNDVIKDKNKRIAELERLEEERKQEKRSYDDMENDPQFKLFFTKRLRTYLDEYRRICDARIQAIQIACDEEIEYYKNKSMPHAAGKPAFDKS